LLRVLFSAWLSGTPLPKVSAMLGHVSITLQLYSFHSEDENRFNVAFCGFDFSTWTLFGHFGEGKMAAASR
jgi:hypothetical protein